MQSVDFIQKYIKPSDGDEQFFYANYNMYDVMENAFMFKRSEVHVKL